MKLSVSQLRRIIKEEVSRMLENAEAGEVIKGYDVRKEAIDNAVKTWKNSPQIHASHENKMISYINTRLQVSGYDPLTVEEIKSLQIK